jgi:regulator of nucleoside diphosphate kinase
MQAREQVSARPRIVIAASEHNSLSVLAEKAAERDSHVGDYLANELSRAFIVPDGECATNVVRMGSTVTYREDATGRIRKVRLVYPREANIDRNQISVLTPIGAALIGLSVAQTIQWLSPTGTQEPLTVLAVDQEP